MVTAAHAGAFCKDAKKESAGRCFGIIEVENCLAVSGAWYAVTL